MRNDKYKIVYCTPALYSAGGTERVVSVKANYFADVLGYDVTIIVTEGKNGNSSKLRPKFITFTLLEREKKELPFLPSVTIIVTS